MQFESGLRAHYAKIRRRFYPIESPLRPVVSVTEAVESTRLHELVAEASDIVRMVSGSPIEMIPANCTIKSIQRVVARYYGYSVTELLSRRRTKNLVQARQIAMFIAKTVTGRSMPVIGRLFDNRDHTTIIHAVRKIEVQCRRDREFSAQVDELLASLRIERAA